MNALAVKIHKAGLQLVIHAAGDKAVDAALTAIEITSKETVGKRSRNRIEQAAVLNLELLERIKNGESILIHSDGERIGLNKIAVSLASVSFSCPRELAAAWIGKEVFQVEASHISGKLPR